MARLRFGVREPLVALGLLFVVFTPSTLCAPLDAVPTTLAAALAAAAAALCVTATL